MKTIMLAGNPNSGKSLVFSRITGLCVVSANYAGTTVDIKKGRFRYHDNEYEMVDAPGLYSLEVNSDAEKAALDNIEKCDILINIIDSTNLERNLSLTLQLAAMRKPMVVCLNFWDDTSHKGISINAKELENLLDVPVVTVSALSGEGMSDLIASLEKSRVSGVSYSDKDDRWATIGSIIDKVQKIRHRHHTVLERLSDISLHPVGGLVMAAAVLSVTFLILRFVGEWLTNSLMEPFFTGIYNPAVTSFTGHIPYGFIRGLLIGYTSDPLQSFGILTSGVYIALVLVFPYFFTFYLLFGFLEDFGYLPRLAVVLDTFFHRIGLHGESSIPIMLGLGCKVPAFLATRTLVNKKEKILTLALIMMSAPCLPQSAMIVSLGMHYGIAPVISVFVILVANSLVINALLNRIIKGNTPELFMEIPSCRMPSIVLLGKKLWFRILDYFKEVFPLIAIGVLVINVLEYLHVIIWMTDTVGRGITAILGLPGEIAPVMLLGFLRKDVSISLIAPFNLSAHQFITASVFLVLYVPCIASFFSIIKEIKIKAALAVVALSFFSATAVSSLIHLFFVLLETSGAH
jgi:ferrous iron transport protein B